MPIPPLWYWFKDEIIWLLADYTLGIDGMGGFAGFCFVLTYDSS